MGERTKSIVFAWSFIKVLGKISPKVNIIIAIGIKIKLLEIKFKLLKYTVK